MPRRRAAREGLDDDHAAAATWTCRLVVIGSIGIGRFALRLLRSEQFADARDVVGAGGVCQQAVVAGSGGARSEGGGGGSGGGIPLWRRELYCICMRPPYLVRSPS